MGKINRAEIVRRARARRERRPKPQVVPSSDLKASSALTRRMSRDHTDVLQNIEFVLTTFHRQSEEVDDRIVRDAVAGALCGSEPDDSQSREIRDALSGMRAERRDVSDQIWAEGLRVVYTSILNHSRCRPGEDNYLSFVSDFMP